MGTFSLSFHNLCSTMRAQRMKFQRNYSLGSHLVVMLGKNVQAKEVNLNGNDSISTSVACASYLPHLYMYLHCLQFVRANHNTHKSDNKEMSFSSCIENPVCWFPEFMNLIKPLMLSHWNTIPKQTYLTICFNCCRVVGHISPGCLGFH